MTRRLVVGCLVAGAMMVALAGPALAGGWATTTLDEVPAELESGETYSIGYTILQHGKSPAVVEDTMIRIRSVGSGKELTFPGAPTGEKGHYVAEVTFPQAGEWEWEVVQGYFGPQSLGTVTVQDAAPVAGSTASSGTSVMEVARIVLPAATVLAVLLFAVQLGLFIRQRGHGAPARSGLSESPISGD